MFDEVLAKDLDPSDEGYLTYSVAEDGSGSSTGNKYDSVSRY